MTLSRALLIEFPVVLPQRSACVRKTKNGSGRQRRDSTSDSKTRRPAGFLGSIAHSEAKRSLSHIGCASIGAYPAEGADRRGVGRANLPHELVEGGVDVLATAGLGREGLGVDHGRVGVIPAIRPSWPCRPVQYGQVLIEFIVFITA